MVERLHALVLRARGVQLNLQASRGVLCRARLCLRLLQAQFQVGYLGHQLLGVTTIL